MIEKPQAVVDETAYSTHPGGRGFAGHTLRTDRYRLVRWINGQGKVGLVELYDYEKDPLETINIADKHPELVADLTRKLAIKMHQVVKASHQPTAALKLHANE